MSNFTICFEDALIFFDCPRLEVCGDHCSECDGAGVIPLYVGTLFANLAVAAALCAAFRQGEYFERDTAIGGWRLNLRWAPGCGLEAPGWSAL